LQRAETAPNGITMKNASPLAKARSFGLSVGTVLVVISAFLVWRGRIGRAEILGAIGIALVVFGYVWPAALAGPSRVWWAIAGVLGWINARVILSLAFFLVLTPLGLVWRLMGRDPMNWRRSHFAGWSTHPARYRDDRHFERMY